MPLYPLAGFSQGGALAIHTGLRYPKKSGGIISLFGYLPLEDKLVKEINPANASMPIMMAHGNMDYIIPISIAKLTYNILVNLGYKVEFNTYQMEHSICKYEVDNVSNWLKKRLS